jgi:hypothetical protein
LPQGELLLLLLLLLPPLPPPPPPPPPPPLLLLLLLLLLPMSLMKSLRTWTNCVREGGVLGVRTVVCRGRHGKWLSV